MCGIAGVLTKKATKQQYHAIDVILQSQYSRGPDCQAQTQITGLQSEILLGHNRLSIIDLSESANQPLWDATGRYCIVYNGEIYNYVELKAELIAQGAEFKTQGDTEVILNAFLKWGVDALDRFHGPFAFALFDKKSEKLWLCRDRFGVRPLYYIILQDSLYFASTATPLAKLFSLAPNMAYIARGLNYLVYEDGTDETQFEKLLALPGGSFLSAQFEQNRLKYHVQKYYTLTEQVQKRMAAFSVLSIDELEQSIHHQLKHAVNIRLRSDVPLGISLSGGLDSSSVATLVRQQQNNLVGFSYGHPDDKTTEGPVVLKCAQYIGLEMEYVKPTLDSLVESFEKTLICQDAPFSSLSMVAQFLLYERVHAKGVKVLLGGQGGDEAFLGYKKFLMFWLRQLKQKKHYMAFSKNAFYLIPMLLAEASSLKSYWAHRKRFSSNNSKHASALNLPAIPALHLGGGGGRLWERQVLDITQLSLPTLLRYEDRNAMAHSVESRLPYLDHQLIEMGLALPETMKLRAGYGKWVIRKLMQDQLPNSIRWARYKRGFDIPLKPLLKAGLGQWIRKSIGDSVENAKNFLNSAVDWRVTFSDHAFLQHPERMREAITLLWLNKIYP